MSDAQSEIAREMERHTITPQQARNMALDQLHRAEAGREACRASEVESEIEREMEAVRMEPTKQTEEPCKQS